jgi:cysteine desulfurase/selenocysteine lyase
VGTFLFLVGIDFRTGHHGAQPLLEGLGVPAPARASLGLYNTVEEMDALVRGIEKVREVFA